MNLSEFRAKYPQYDDLSDQQLADGLYSKYYSDLDRSTFYSSIGLQPGKPAGPRVLPDTDTSSDFFRGMSNIPGQVQEMYGAVKTLAGKVADSPEMMRAGVQTMQAGQAKQTVRESDSFTNAWDKGITAVVTDWLPYQVGSGLGSVLESLTAMAAGAGVGAVSTGGVGTIPGAAAGLVGKTLVKKGAMEVAQKIAKEQGEEAAKRFVEAEAKTVLRQAGIKTGAQVGLGAQAGLAGFGETTGRAVEEAGRPEDIELSRVLPAGLVSTVAEFIGDKIALGAFKVNPASTQNLALDIAKAIAVTGAKETPVELIQTAAERYGAKLSLDDAEALKEYVDTMAAAFGMSIGPGAIGGVRTRMSAQQAKAAQQPQVPGQPQAPAPPTTPLTPEEQQAEAERKARVDALLAEGETPATTPAVQTQPIAEVTPQPVTQVTPVTTTPAANQEQFTEVKQPASPVKTTEPANVPEAAQTVETKEERPTAPTKGTANADFFARPSQPEEPVVEPIKSKKSPVKLDLKQFNLSDFSEAVKYVQDIEDGKVRINPAILNKYATQLGVRLPRGGTKEEKYTALRNGLYVKGVEGRATELWEDMVWQADTKAPIVRFNELPKISQQRFLSLVAEDEKVTPENADRILDETVQLAGYWAYNRGENAGRLENLTDLQALEFGDKKAKKGADVGDVITGPKQLVREADVYARFYAALPDNYKQRVVDAAKNYLEQAKRSGRYTGDTLDTTIINERAAEHAEQIGTKAAEMAVKAAEDRAKASGKKLTDDSRQKLYERTYTKFYNKEYKKEFDKLAEANKIGSSKDMALLSVLEGDTPLPASAIKLLERGAFIDALAEIDAKTSNEFLSALASRLGGLLQRSSIRVVIRGPLTMADGRRVAGAVNEDANVLYLDRDFGMSVETLLHEAIHIATMHVIDQRVGLTPIQRDALYELKVLYKFAVRKGLIPDHIFKRINLSSEHDQLKEFVAYALTESDFQEVLARTPYLTVRQEMTYVWEKFKRVLLDMLGITVPKSALDALLMTTDTLFRAPPSKSSGIDGIRRLREPTQATTIALTRQPKQGERKRVADLDNIPADYELSDKEKPRSSSDFFKMFTSASGWQSIARAIQNDRYPIRLWENTYDLSGLLIRTGSKINNIYEQITLATGKAREYYMRDVRPAYLDVEQALDEYAKKTGKSVDKTLSEMHMIAEALHEPERRMVKYLRLVPLTDNAAARRDAIFKALKTETLTKAEAEALRKRLNKIVFKNLDADGNPANYEVTDNVDTYGKSPLQVTKKDNTIKGMPTSFYPTEQEGDVYNVTGLSQDSIATITNQYENHPFRNDIDRVLKAVKKVTDIQAKLDKEANYWSDKVSNHVNFYGWQHYVPLKGKDRSTHTVGPTDFDDMLDFNGRTLGNELQDAQDSMEGRTSASNNSILQALSDAVRASARAGRRDVTLAVKNSLSSDKKNPGGQGLLSGRVAAVIPFEDRDTVDLDQYKRDKFIFHYDKDGTVYILEVQDPKYLQAIRRTYRSSNPIVNAANEITSFIGKTHTRYNYQFAPKNFVTDAMTNAFTISAEMGPGAAKDFISSLANRVVFKNGMYKAMMVASMYGKPGEQNRKTLQALAAKDPYIRDMVEYVEVGGMVSYLSSMTLKSQFEELYKQIGRSGIVRKKEQADQFIDIWNDMFELASRSAAYAATRDRYIKQKMSPEDARVKAAAYVKNLANFEQVGEFGRTLGALYMFFRPAATGAVRAIEAVAPAFRSLESAESQLSSRVLEDPAALKMFRDNYKERQRNARITVAGSMMMGAAAYSMALMMADEDDLGRNTVANDNMQQWTRYARFHIPQKISKGLLGLEEPLVIQLPWGFGLGAFAAAGAQATSAVFGGAKVTDALSNVFLQIAFDSFIPIPISRMPPTEMPLEFMIDSISPSFVRPAIEFLINKDGLGRDIYNDRNRRFGDAYTGGDKIPEIYKDAARYLTDETNGALDISPNTMYFLANSYADGFARLLFEMPYGMTQLSKGEKQFNPKTDIPLLGSFFGSRGSVDAREFSAVERQIADKERRLKMFATNPPKYADYISKNPFDEVLVESFNKTVGGELNKLRQEANEIRRMNFLSPADKQALLKANIFQQNLVKFHIVNMAKTYDVNP